MKREEGRGRGSIADLPEALVRSCQELFKKLLTTPLERYQAAGLMRGAKTSTDFNDGSSMRTSSPLHVQYIHRWRIEVFHGSFHCMRHRMVCG